MFTHSCNHLHINDNRLHFFILQNGLQVYLSMAENVTHSYVPLERFMNVPNICQPVNHNVASLVGKTATVTSTNNTDHHSKSEISRIVNKVHDHVCGHSSYGDMKTLLERNKLCNPEVQQELSTIMENIHHVLYLLHPPLLERYPYMALTENSMTWYSLIIFGLTIYALFT